MYTIRRKKKQDRVLIQHMGKMVVFFVIFFALVPAVGQEIPIQERQWGFVDTKVYEAWQYTKGTDKVVVAIIDNGFDTFHPYLFDNAWKNEDEIPDNGIDDDANGYVDDVFGWNFVPEDRNRDGRLDAVEMKGNNDPRPDVLFITPEERAEGIVHHGTIVAGIIGATGGRGINWHVRLMNIKVVDNTGIGGMDRLPAAIAYAVDNGADIINMSMVGSPTDEVQQAITDAYRRGVAIIAAAGNDGASLDLIPKYPICVDAGEGEEFILGVSAIRRDHRLARFSNYGASCIDITAPGSEITSTLRYSPQYGFPEKIGGGWAGTSFATPFVSAAAALVKSVQPMWRAKELYDAILSTVHRTPPADVAEYERIYGAGLLQIDNAVRFASEKKGSETLKNIAVIDAKKGSAASLEPGGRSTSVALPFSGKVFDDVAGVAYNGQQWYVAALPALRGKSRVVLYSDAWKEEVSFEVPIPPPLRIVAGDVVGGEEPEIILAPQGAGQEVFRIYSLLGELHGTYQETKKHSGVALTLAMGEGEKKDIIALVHGAGKTQALMHFGGESRLLESFALLDENGGSLGAGDIDGDGDTDYAIGGRIGAEPTLTYYAGNGEQIRRFYAYAPEYRNGFDMAIGKFDADAAEDIILLPWSNIEPVRVWTGESRRLLDDWMPFADGGDAMKWQLLVF
ncbi:MAG: S8 family peptidase [Patescibacteria group bacterium]|mgnify:CR=1 FL=1